jgi:hypothetical protein
LVCFIGITPHNPLDAVSGFQDLRMALGAKMHWDTDFNYLVHPAWLT